MKCIRVNNFEEIETDWLRLFRRQLNTPFQSFPYNQLFISQFCDQDNIYILKILDQEKVVAIVAFELIAEVIVFVGMKPVLGKEEITDYGDIVVDMQYCQNKTKYQLIWETIFNYFKDLHIQKLQLDYVREDSLIWQILKEREHTITTPIEVAPWINLSCSWDEYIASLKRIDRKELKRKLKRIELQSYQLIEMDTIRKEDFDQFITLHKLSDTAKEKFMSEEMASFFWQVSQINYSLWKTKLWFLEIDNKKVAAIMGFVSDNHLLMYNSGFDPAFSYYSVGLLSHALILQKYFNSRYQIFDFMRGSERYKYDLGAINLQLYRISLNLNSF